MQYITTHFRIAAAACNRRESHALALEYPREHLRKDGKEKKKNFG